MKHPNLGRSIAHWRHQRVMTQTWLAEKAGLSFPLVQKLEQGATDNPRLDTLRRLARALAIRTADLLPEDDWQPEPLKRRYRTRDGEPVTQAGFGDTLYLPDDAVEAAQDGLYDKQQ